MTEIILSHRASFYYYFLSELGTTSAGLAYFHLLPSDPWAAGIHTTPSHITVKLLHPVLIFTGTEKLAHATLWHRDLTVSQNI